MKNKMLIGIITTECHSEYQGEIMRGIISQAFKSSCDIAVICPLTNFLIETKHKFNEKSIFNLILSDSFSGFVYDRNSFYNEETQLYIDKLCTRSGKPVMLIDYNNHNRFETTMADDIDAFEMMTDHLIEVHGHKKIYCLTGIKGILCSEERLKGYLRSMKKHGLPIDKSYYIYGDFWHNSAAELAQNIISGKLSKPDAVVCGNDIMAAALAENLINGGFRVPEDIAITGFDATLDGYHANPSITSCKRPNFQLGAEAFRRLYRIITGRICSKVNNEPGEIRLGKSCGCTENPELKREIQRKLRTAERLQNKLFNSDMLIDITNTNDITSLIDRIDHYTYLIYKMNQMFICVTEKFENEIGTVSNNKLDFNISDPVNIVFDKSAVCRNEAYGKCSSTDEAINLFCNCRKQPSAFYISPLHYNDNFFGYIAVSFGKHPITYSKLYLQWVNYVNMAFEKVKMQSAVNTALKRYDSLTVYDKVTGLLTYNGFKNSFEALKSNLSNNNDKTTFVFIELTDIKKYFYQNGRDKTTHIIKLFADTLKNNMAENEICGAIAPDCFGAIVFKQEHVDTIFQALKNMRISTDESSPSFTIGTYSFETDSNISLTDILHKASINTIHTYTGQKTQINPQFEKLCQLRNRLMANPEHAWNITEIADNMFISKSYLQKIYKSYFGKSIIEELIEFRLNKAKELLKNTEFTVSDISRECGYSTYNYFVRQFRTAEGISPSEYRELNMK